ncbi:neuropeptide S receptor-like [Centruroides vittatus]|uniref:neuropeptide S receptor-like n=1 Tax=Centruroides vittatus TaxID=120091 RepID=UPI00350F48FE
MSNETDFNLTWIHPTKDEKLEVLGPQYHKNVRIFILATMIGVSLIGNTIVCWQLLPTRRRRYPKAKVLFLNLAVADLLVTLITMTSQMVWEMMGRLWIAGDVFCRIFKLIQTFALVSSTYMLVSIALDRHHAIVRPLSPCPRPINLAIVAWLASLIPSLPNLYVFRQVTLGPGRCYCASLFYTGEYPIYHRQIYMAFVFLAVFIVPFFLLVVLYTWILVEIWRQSSVFSGNQSNSALPRAKVKTLKMTLVIFLAFICTNLPYVIQEMILAFGDPSALDTNIVALFGVISASNSAINPYIYLMFHASGGCLERFRKFLKTVGNMKSGRWNDAINNAFHSASLKRKVSFSSSSRQSVITRAPTLTQQQIKGVQTALLHLEGQNENEKTETSL